MFKRGKAAREREELKIKQSYPNQYFKRFIQHCQIKAVIGPEDGTEEAKKVRELYHIYVKVESSTGVVLTVPIADSHSLIYLVYGGPKNLIGKYCTVEYIGNSIADAEIKGIAHIERDMQARLPEDRPNLSIGALAGIMNAPDHSKLGTQSDYEGSEQ